MIFSSGPWACRPLLPNSGTTDPTALPLPPRPFEGLRVTPSGRAQSRQRNLSSRSTLPERAGGGVRKACRLSSSGLGFPDEALQAHEAWTAAPALLKPPGRTIMRSPMHATALQITMSRGSWRRATEGVAFAERRTAHIPRKNVSGTAAAGFAGQIPGEAVCI